MEMDIDEGAKAIKAKADKIRDERARKSNTEDIIRRMEYIAHHRIPYHIDIAVRKNEQIEGFETYQIAEDGIDIPMFFDMALEFSENNKGFLLSFDNGTLTLDYSKADYYIAYKAFMRDKAKFTNQIFDSIGGTLKVSKVMESFLKAYINQLEVNDVIEIEVIDG